VNGKILLGDWIEHLCQRSSFVGYWSWLLFHSLKVNTAWLTQSQCRSGNLIRITRGQKYLCVNDLSERAVQLIQDFLLASAIILNRRISICCRLLNINARRLQTLTKTRWLICKQIQLHLAKIMTAEHSIAHCLILTRLDYCNSVLYRLPESTLFSFN